jgi:hypothetical protein
MALSVSGRKIAEISGLRHSELKKLEANGILSRDSDGRFPLEPSIKILFQHLRERIHLAEKLCRRWCTDELESRWQARGIADDDE